MFGGYNYNGLSTIWNIIQQHNWMRGFAVPYGIGYYDPNLHNGSYETGLSGYGLTGNNEMSLSCRYDHSISASVFNVNPAWLSSNENAALAIGAAVSKKSVMTTPEFLGALTSVLKGVNVSITTGSAGWMDNYIQLSAGEGKTYSGSTVSGTVVKSTTIGVNSSWFSSLN